MYRRSPFSFNAVRNGVQIMGPNLSTYLKTPPPAMGSLVRAYVDASTASSLRHTLPATLPSSSFDPQHWAFLTGDLPDGTPVAICHKAGLGQPERVFGIGFLEGRLGTIPMFHWTRHPDIADGTLPTIDNKYWSHKLQTALQTRREQGVEYARNTVYRLVNGAGDGVPGLFVTVNSNIIHVRVNGDGALSSLYALHSLLQSEYSQPNYHIACSVLDSGWGFVPSEPVEPPAVENGVVHPVHLLTDLTGVDKDFVLDPRYRGFRAALQFEASGRDVLDIYPGAGHNTTVATHAGAASVLLLEDRERAISLLQQQMARRRGANPGLATSHPLESLNDVDVEAFHVVVLSVPRDGYPGKSDELDALVRGAMRCCRTGATLFVAFESGRCSDITRAVSRASNALRRKAVVARYFVPGPDYPIDAANSNLSAPVVGLQVRMDS